jgi:uncharacterized protein YjfI (DUF2170 family)
MNNYCRIILDYSDVNPFTSDDRTTSLKILPLANGGILFSIQSDYISMGFVSNSLENLVQNIRSVLNNSIRNYLSTLINYYERIKKL